MSLERPLPEFQLVAEPSDARYRPSSQEVGWRIVAEDFTKALRDLMSQRFASFLSSPKPEEGKMERREPFLRR